MSGLHVTEAIGTGALDAAAAHESWDTYDEVAMKLHQAGFPEAELPPFSRPILTPDLLTRATSDAITELYTQVSGWQGYTNNLCASIRGYLLQTDNELTFHQARLRTDLKKAYKKTDKKRPTAVEIEDTITLDPLSQQLTLQKQELLQQKYKLEAHAESLKNDMKVASRQVEIRRQDLEGGLGGRGYPRSRLPDDEPGHME